MRETAHGLEDAVRSTICEFLLSPEKYLNKIRPAAIGHTLAEECKKTGAAWAGLETSKKDEFIRGILHKVIVSGTAISVELDGPMFLSNLLSQKSIPLSGTELSHKITLIRPFRILRRGAEARIIAPDETTSGSGVPIASLVKAIACSHNWYEQIISGRIATTNQIAKQYAVSATYIRRLVHCAGISPRLAEAILTGRHRPNLLLKDILQNLPVDWRKQEKILSSPRA